MRKCHLCGSVIRRRAEFCRFCTAPQPGARAAHRNGTAVGSPPGGPPWMVPAPTETALATTSAVEAPPPGSFEPVWDAVDTRRPKTTENTENTENTETFDVEMSSATAEPEPDPWVFDEPVRSADVQVARPEHPLHYPSTVRPAEVVPEPEAIVEATPVAEPQEVAEPEVVRDPEPVVEPAAEVEPLEPPAPTNGHGTGNGKNGTNGTKGANGQNGTNGKNGSTPGTPLDLLRRPKASNGNGRRNGRHGGNGHDGSSTKNGAAKANGVASAARPEPPPPPPVDREPLAGFEDFPDSVAPPEVRWG